MTSGFSRFFYKTNIDLDFALFSGVNLTGQTTSQKKNGRFFLKINVPVFLFVIVYMGDTIDLFVTVFRLSLIIFNWLN